jgi:four helix bundle protein
MHNYKELKIWQRSMVLVKQIYELTETFPKDELYGLRSQIRRCAVSIPSNIAEGSGRKNQAEFAHFLSIANGSSYELTTQLILSQELQIVGLESISPILNDLDEIQKMIFVLVEKFKKN